MKKRIVIVSEYMTQAESEEGAKAPGLLLGLLRQAGISESDCHFTHVIAEEPPGGRGENLLGTKSQALSGYRAVFGNSYLKAEHAHHLERLQRELEYHEPNIVIALGAFSLCALCKKSGIKKYRGSPLLTHDGRFKVMPTWPMLSIIRLWELRVIALADLAKAREEAAFPELRRPSRRLWLEPSLSDIERFYDKYIVPADYLSCDIETKQRTITEIGYATPDGAHAIVIPFYSRLASDGNYWDTFAEERQAWKWVRRINAEKPLIGQNFAYDMNYLWRTMGIPCPKFAGDTMLLHHSLQLEMEKSLGFLGSIYTSEPSWKFMRQKQDTLKKGDE